jgi:leucine dehydrogenase
MSVFENAAFDNHEEVAFFADPASGLRAIIAVHSTALGPSAGGCRLWTYANSAAALTDALRLSRGMSYKSAIAGLALGGGKAVVIKPSDPFDRERLFLAFGRAVESLKGRYVTAEDVGMAVADMNVITRETSHVAGRAQGRAASGDPSPKTAAGVFLALRIAAKRRLQRSDLRGLRVAVQGIGHVGYKLCRLLHAAGATLIVCDIDMQTVQKAEAEFGARAVSLDAIYDQDVDVFSPCALGAILNRETLPRLKAKVVAGAANNQLADDGIGADLMSRAILYAPDYVANGGGIINVAAEVSGTYDPSWVEAKIAGLGTTLEEVFARAELQRRPPGEVADAIARERIAGARRL